MSIRFRHLCAVTLAMSLAIAPACTTGQEKSAQDGQKQQPGLTGAGGGVQPQASSTPGGVRELGVSDATIQLLPMENKMFVPVSDLVTALQFNTVWDPDTKTLRMGDNDLPIAFTIDSTQAEKDGDPVTLAEAPNQQGDAFYLPVSAVADLLTEDMSTYEVQGDRLILHPSNVNIFDQAQAGGTGQDEAQLDFADDPNDPFKGPPSDENTGTEIPASVLQRVTDLPAGAAAWNEEARAVAAKNIDIDGLIRKGKQYMGVKYQFGARPYPVSGRFDCSTFTQYLFGKYGISLPRLARQQAKLGTLVSRKNLRKGDLMFFYVPGRFKSNRTVGHVGIYIGNGQMLNANSAPKNGVQIININRPYWKRVFLFAKRVAY